MSSYKKCLVLIISLFIAACVNATEDEMNESKKKQLYELPQNCDFMEVGNNASKEFACSPRLLDRFTSPFRGLLINGPADVVWPKNISKDEFTTSPFGGTSGPLRLMVAGLSKVPDSTLGLDVDAAHEILIVAVDQLTAKSYSGKMKFFGFRGSKPSAISLQSELPGVFPKVDDYDKSDTARKKYFNIDLVENLGIPIVNATYSVYATLGEYKSNVLIIKTTVK